MKENSIKSHIIQIGNSQGVRIPKTILNASAIEREIEISVENGCIVIRSAHKPRAGWEESFKEMHAQEDDLLLDGDDASLTTWDDEEWEW